MFDEKLTQDVNIVTWDDDEPRMTIDLPRFCPVCHQRTRPHFLYGHFDASDKQTFTCLFSCSCGNIFMSKYIGGLCQRSTYVGSVPDGFEEKQFGDDISELSPNFCLIYNQAAKAEANDLKMICGMGYRKAIEFLIKDFCILKNPDEKDKILAEKLFESIKRIDDPNIQHLAKACKDLGNDETHVVVKYDEGLIELKNYIDGLVAYIHLNLLSDHADQTYCK